MPLLNYTTKIDANRTVSEIQHILAAHGARSISVDYDDRGTPAAVTFMVIVREIPINFRLPSNHIGVFNVLKADKDIQKRFKTEEHAWRVAWRILKDWVEAQMAIIEAGLATMAEVFLPYAVMPDGQTVYQKFASDQRFLTG